jgi:predicted transcriptional regulator
MAESEQKEKSILGDLFLRDKPTRILLALKSARDRSKPSVYATLLSKEADCTYSHTIKILNILQKAGLVVFDKKGRIKQVKLTDDGLDVAHNMEAVKRKVDQLEEKFRKQIKVAGKKEKKAEKK